MKKSMNYVVYAGMGVLAEAILLRVLNVQISLENTLGALFFVVLTFVAYRFFMDWNYFNNEHSKNLKYLAIDEGIMSKFYYALFIGLGVFLANFEIVQVSIARLLFFSIVSVIMSWYVANFLREIANFISVEVENWNTSKSLKKLS